MKLFEANAKINEDIDWTSVAERNRLIAELQSLIEKFTTIKATLETEPHPKQQLIMHKINEGLSHAQNLLHSILEREGSNLSFTS